MSSLAFDYVLSRTKCTYVRTSICVYVCVGIPSWVVLDLSTNDRFRKIVYQIILLQGCNTLVVIVSGCISLFLNVVYVVSEKGGILEYI